MGNEDRNRLQQRMISPGRRELVSALLEAAIMKQRQAWDLALRVQEITNCWDRDVYALVSELAGGLRDDESVPLEVVRGLLQSM